MNLLAKAKLLEKLTASMGQADLSNPYEDWTEEEIDIYINCIETREPLPAELQAKGLKTKKGYSSLFSYMTNAELKKVIQLYEEMGEETE